MITDLQNKDPETDLTQALRHYLRDPPLNLDFGAL